MTIDEKIDVIIDAHYLEANTLQEMCHGTIKMILQEIEKLGTDTKDLSTENEYKHQSEDRAIWNTAIENMLEGIRKLLGEGGKNEQ